MRGVVFFVLLLLAFIPAQAQLLSQQPQKEQNDTMLPMAMKYFSRCMGDLFPGISPATRNNFCACSADFARQKLSLQELTLIAEGRADIPDFDQKEFDTKIETQVNAPCLHFIIREDVRETCLSDDKNAHFFVTQKGFDTMCSCLSDHVAEFMQLYGADMVAVMLARRGGLDNNKDLLGTVQEWPDYTSEYGRWRDECLNSYAYR